MVCCRSSNAERALGDVSREMDVLILFGSSSTARATLQITQLQQHLVVELPLNCKTDSQTASKPGRRSEV
jgi:hypothetical protein